MGTTMTFGILPTFVTPPGDDSWCSGSFVGASFRGRPRADCHKIHTSLTVTINAEEHFAISVAQQNIGLIQPDING